MPRKTLTPAVVDVPASDLIEIPIPDVQVRDRAIADPFGQPSTPILLKDPQFVTRWVNTELAGGSQLTNALAAGYLKTKPDYLADAEGFHWNTSPDGFVTRGERHREILMYTTKDHQKRRAWAKTETNMKRMRMSKPEIQTAASAHFGKDGDQAADFLGKHVGGVEDSHEIIARESQDGAA